MGNGNQQNLGSMIATVVVAALLGFLFIANAGAVPHPLQAIDIAVGAIFMLAAVVLAFKQEGE